jgi:choline dehydrogenase-like flavoprotein
LSIFKVVHFYNDVSLLYRANLPAELNISFKDDNAQNQRWVFQLVDGQAGAGAGRSFQERFFTLKPEDVSNDKEGYDIIIVGTGIGGGVLAADLFDTNSKVGFAAKKILVIERGNLLFHSHCLNAARPSGLAEDRGQQNDTFFSAFRGTWPGTDPDIKNWNGGPIYCLGGRSSVWGLFAPRVHDRTLEENFPKQVREELIDEYYEKAEKLMKLSLPVTKPRHQHLIDRLNATANPQTGVQWQWGRIASEFSDTKNYDFAEGAYSSIDRLLEIAMSKPVVNKVEQEHINFRILLGVEVLKINWQGNTASGVRVKAASGEFDFKLKTDGKVVLCAGSVDSPVILLRSGYPLYAKGGCRLTDHEILFRAKSFRYRNPNDRADIGSMKLQTYASVGHNDVVLMNMSIDASTFLPRSKTPFNDLPKWIMVFIKRNPLVQESNIELRDDKPFVTIKRTVDKDANDKERVMQDLTQKAEKAISDVLKVDFLSDPKWGDEYFKVLGLGAVAHELGTIPMPQANVREGCIDENLKLREREGVYVCDLSVFPYSPEANPTLTLAALAIRLSRTLVSRRRVILSSDEKNVIAVVNHSGKDIRVFVSNKAGVNLPKNEDIELGPGFLWKWTRGYVYESISVYRINPQWSPDAPNIPKFWKIPEVYVGPPGLVVVILEVGVQE